MIMSQQEFINSDPRYNFAIAIVDTKTKQEKIIGHKTDDLDEIIYEFGDVIEEIDKEAI